jgi:hypothetical protein
MKSERWRCSFDSFNRRFDLFKLSNSEALLVPLVFNTNRDICGK